MIPVRLAAVIFAFMGFIGIIVAIVKVETVVAKDIYGPLIVLAVSAFLFYRTRNEWGGRR